MCQRPTVEITRSDEDQAETRRVVVEAEPFEEFIVDASSLSERELQDFSTTVAGSGIRLVNSAKEYHFFERRKAWLVNGSLLALSAYGYPLHETIKDAGADPDLVTRLDRIQQLLSIALTVYGQYTLDLDIPEAKLGEQAGLRAFCDQVLTRASASEYRITGNLAELFRLHGAHSRLETLLESFGTDATLSDRLSAVEGLLTALDMSAFLRRVGDRLIEPVSYILEHEDQVSAVDFLSIVAPGAIEMLSLLGTVHSLMEADTKDSARQLTERIQQSRTELD